MRYLILKDFLCLTKVKTVTADHNLPRERFVQVCRLDLSLYIPFFGQQFPFRQQPGQILHVYHQGMVLQRR